MDDGGDSTQMSVSIGMTCLLLVQEKYEEEKKGKKVGSVLQTLDPVLTNCGILRSHLGLLYLFCLKGIIIIF